MSFLEQDTEKLKKGLTTGYIQPTELITVLRCRFPWLSIACDSCPKIENWINRGLICFWYKDKAMLQELLSTELDSMTLDELKDKDSQIYLEELTAETVLKEMEAYDIICEKCKIHACC